jgi:hypothetical protein
MAAPLFDVALSFAGEQREFVREIAAELHAAGVRYFFDEERVVDLWGRNLIDELDAIYRSQARFVVMFVSQEYATKVWTNHERQSAQSRSLQQSDPYILPVRFDDADLPGMPPTIFYLDARTMSATKISEVIVEKVGPITSDDDDDRGPGWEYLLFIDELQSALDGYEREWRDFEAQYVRPVGRKLDITEIADDLGSRSKAALKIVANVERLLNSGGLEAAFGAVGEQGDADEIRHYASRVIDVYAELLRWAADARGTLVPDEAEPVYWALAEYADLPLRQIRDFVAQLDREVRPVVEDLRSGKEFDEPVVLSFTLTVSIAPETLARFEAACAAFAASIE